MTGAPPLQQEVTAVFVFTHSISRAFTTSFFGFLERRTAKSQRRLLHATRGEGLASCSC